MIDFEQFDLVPLHLILSLAGLFMCACLITLSRNNLIYSSDKTCFKVGSWVAYGGAATALAWGATFCLQKNWQPWPPYLMLEGALDLRMLISILAVYFKNTDGTEISRSA